jgi:ribonuclease HII
MLALNYSSFLLETGTDEAGRGCLAGPVTATAVILPANFENKILNDSKQLSEKVRERLKPIIEEQAISFAVTHLEPLVIDEINILNASIKAMQESILKLHPKPEYIIVDGNRFKPVLDIPHSCIVRRCEIHEYCRGLGLG